MFFFYSNHCLNIEKLGYSFVIDIKLIIYICVLYNLTKH